MRLVLIGLIGIGAAGMVALFGGLALKFNQSLENGQAVPAGSGMRDVTASQSTIVPGPNP